MGVFYVEGSSFSVLRLSVRVDLGHCLGTVDPLVHWEEDLVSKGTKIL